MKLLKKYNKELEFKSNISEVTSISMDIFYDVLDSNIEGKLKLSGFYVSSDLENIKEEFNYDLPFSYEIDKNAIKESISASIDDFTYDICKNLLNVNVDIEVSYDVTDIEEKEEFDSFLRDHEVDIVNLTDEVKTLEELDRVENTIEDEEGESEEVSDEETNDESRKLEDNILDIASSTNDEYITYHIYIVSEVDTLEGIADKYHISIDLIKEYNEIDTIKSGMKLVIPIPHE